MNEEMIRYLLDNPDGVPSHDLAERFLRIRRSHARPAHQAVAAILSRDRRCRFDEARGLWHARPQAERCEEVPLDRQKWCAVFMATDPQQTGRLRYISAWNVFPEPRGIVSCRLIVQNHSAGSGYEPSTEEIVCRSPAEKEGALRMLVRSMCGHVPLFVSSDHAGKFRSICEYLAEAAPDDYLLLGHAMRAAGISVRRPLSVQACYGSLFGIVPDAADVSQYGRYAAECFAEIVRRLFQKGIMRRSELDAVQWSRAPSINFSEKAFSLHDLQSLPEMCGVYGFKDRSDRYMYIGKSTNVKRRVMGYFSRESPESPEKINAIRDRAHAFVYHPCGSDLECCIQEYRLIKKHVPPLNSKVEISERAGRYDPIDDCIVILPHADAERCMSVWFKRDQKAALHPVYRDFRDSAGLTAAIDRFFFGPGPAPSSSDFPEQEIAVRWLKAHRDEVPIIRVAHMADAAATLNAMKQVLDHL